MIVDVMKESLLYTHDNYTAGDANNVVEFHCENKKRTVRALLSGPLSLSVTSQWGSFIQGTGASALLGLADAVGSYVGMTVQQPWFSRKYWKGTEPLKFTLPIQFVAMNDAKSEVMDPMLSLLAMVYPRYHGKDDGSEADLFALYGTPGPSVFQNIIDTKTGEDYIPEGSLARQGDSVTITLGNFLNFNGCYIQNVHYTIPNSFNKDGYPLNVTASVAFEAMDICFVGPNGEFFERGFGNQALKLNDALRKIFEGMEEAIKNMKAGAEKMWEDMSGKLKNLKIGETKDETAKPKPPKPPKPPTGATGKTG